MLGVQPRPWFFDSAAEMRRWFGEGLEVILPRYPPRPLGKGLFRELLAQDGFLAGAHDLVIIDPTEVLFAMSVVERHRADSIE